MNSNQPLETENIHSQHVQVPVVYLRGGNTEFFFNLERFVIESFKSIKLMCFYYSIKKIRYQTSLVIISGDDDDGETHTLSGLEVP